MPLDRRTADLARALRTGTLCDGVSPDLIGRADAHGTLPLLAWRCRRSSAIPRELQQELAAAAARAVAWDVWTATELTVLLDALRAAGVATMVFKGAALARQVYPEPWLRPHGDIDLLVRHDSLPRITAALLPLGYARDTTIDGTYVMQQAHFSRTDGHGVRHVVDVHWRIANPQVFAHALEFEELLADAVPVPSLGGVLAPCAMHALLLALVHRTAHHYDNQRLIWLFDIHLLSDRLAASDWERLVALVLERRMGAVAMRGLDLAEEAFGASWPPHVRDRLAAVSRDNASTVFLESTRRQVDVLMSDVRALPNLRARLALLRQHLFPSRGYMAARYRTSSGLALPWLYARRIIAGAPRWLRKFATSDL